MVELPTEAVLRDGTTVEVRASREGDLGAVSRLLQGLPEACRPDEDLVDPRTIAANEAPGRLVILGLRGDVVLGYAAYATTSPKVARVSLAVAMPYGSSPVSATDGWPSMANGYQRVGRPPMRSWQIWMMAVPLWLRSLSRRSSPLANGASLSGARRPDLRNARLAASGRWLQR